MGKCEFDPALRRYHKATPKSCKRCGCNEWRVSAEFDGKNYECARCGEPLEMRDHAKDEDWIE